MRAYLSSNLDGTVYFLLRFFRIAKGETSPFFATDRVNT
jgi:hypothetical protein